MVVFTITLPEALVELEALVEPEALVELEALVEWSDLQVC